MEIKNIGGFADFKVGDKIKRRDGCLVWEITEVSENQIRVKGKERRIIEKRLLKKWEKVTTVK